MAILNGGFPGGGGAAEEVYSTEETRIGTWIDGKPLYRRVINATTSPSKLIIPFPQVNEIMLFGWIVASNGNTCMANSAYSPSSSILYYDRLKSEIQFITQSSFWQNVPCVIVAQYTKTTDPTPTSTLSAAPFTARAPSILPTTAVTAAEMGI